MPSEATVLLGIEVPSTNRGFLTIVAVHIVLGLICVVAGAIGMLSPKGPGRHPLMGAIYYWCLSAVFVSATALSAMRWAEDYHLFVFGCLSFAAATVGRTARRRRWPEWVSIHITGMGLSYILLLTAFYGDNGRNLPLWRELPQWTFWVLPSVIGAPIVTYALLHNPVARQPRGSQWPTQRSHTIGT
jgi:hypothetical protein